MLPTSSNLSKFDCQYYDSNHSVTISVHIAKMPNDSSTSGKGNMTKSDASRIQSSQVCRHSKEAKIIC